MRDPATKPTSRLDRLFERKLTPGIALLFFMALAIMCAAAAGIGFVAQKLQHSEMRR